ncbi:DUF6870 family protein [Bacillus spizizenii]|uniref:DUF6870 family protein n=2 Tax=Bacillus spizizenii TaxID=96241 RepID=UPI0035588620
MVILEELEQMWHRDRTTTKTKGLVDNRHIAIDTNLPALERLEKYLEDFQNPYFFMVPFQLVCVFQMTKRII